MILKLDTFTTATIDKETVKSALMQMLEESTGKKTQNIEFIIAKQLRGWGPNEHYETEFEGIRIFFAKEEH